MFVLSCVLAFDPVGIRISKLTGEKYLLNKSSQELDNSLQRVFLQILLGTQQTEHIDKVIVNSIILRAQLGEEHAAQICDSFILVLETLCHFSELALDLDLSSKNEECESHETCSLNASIFIIEAAVEEVGVFVDEVIKADSHVSESDNNVRSSDWVLRTFEYSNEKREISLAILRADTHKFG